MNADVFLADIRWIPAPSFELYFLTTWAETDGMFDTLMPAFADDAPTELFPDGLPGEGPDPTAPVAFADYQGLSMINELSKLDYRELRATLGGTYELARNFELFARLSFYDLEDKAPYLQDATGEVTMAMGGFTWFF